MRSIEDAFGPFFCELLKGTSLYFDIYTDELILKNDQSRYLKCLTKDDKIFIDI